LLESLRNPTGIFIGLLGPELVAVTTIIGKIIVDNCGLRPTRVIEGGFSQLLNISDLSNTKLSLKNKSTDSINKNKR